MRIALSGQSPYKDSGFQRVWLKQNLNSKAWNFPESLSQAILVGIILVGKGCAVFEALTFNLEGPTALLTWPGKKREVSILLTSGRCCFQGALSASCSEPSSLLARCTQRSVSSTHALLQSYRALFGLVSSAVSGHCLICGRAVCALMARHLSGHGAARPADADLSGPLRSRETPGAANVRRNGCRSAGLLSCIRIEPATAPPPPRQTPEWHSSSALPGDQAGTGI